MEHLLQRLYGVDTPVSLKLVSIF